MTKKKKTNVKKSAKNHLSLISQTPALLFMQAIVSLINTNSFPLLLLLRDSHIETELSSLFFLFPSREIKSMLSLMLSLKLIKCTEESLVHRLLHFLEAVFLLPPFLDPWLGYKPSSKLPDHQHLAPYTGYEWPAMCLSLQYTGISGVQSPGHIFLFLLAQQRVHLCSIKFIKWSSWIPHIHRANPWARGLTYPGK